MDNHSTHGISFNSWGRPWISNPSQDQLFCGQRSYQSRPTQEHIPEVHRCRTDSTRIASKDWRREVDDGQEIKRELLINTYATTAIRASSMFRSTNSTTTRRERLMLSQLVVNNSKALLEPTGCVIHTSTTHESKNYRPELSTKSTAASLTFLRDMRCTIIAWSRSKIGTEVISKLYNSYLSPWIGQRQTQIPQSRADRLIFSKRIASS